MLKLNILIEMLSTRKQKAKEKRSRQSDVMSDTENLDVMLGNYQEKEQFREGNVSDREIDLESEGQQRDANPVERNFRSLLNTNLSENSEFTAETSRAINPRNFFTNVREIRKNEIRHEFPYIRGYQLSNR